MSITTPEVVSVPVEADDEDINAHWARRDDIVRSSVTGEPIQALCGRLWVPGRDPSQFPVCKQCAAIKDRLTKGRQGLN